MTGAADLAAGGGEGRGYGIVACLGTGPEQERRLGLVELPGEGPQLASLRSSASATSARGLPVNGSSAKTSTSANRRMSAMTGL